jgi:hypothetical protein
MPSSKIVLFPKMTPKGRDPVRLGMWIAVKGKNSIESQGDAPLNYPQV